MQFGEIRSAHDFSCIYKQRVRVILMASKTNPFTFLQQVRTETSKVTWPTRRETVTSAIMVFIMVILAGIFFFVLDQGLSWFVTTLLSLG